MKVDVPNEIAALPPWVAGYEMGPNDVALMTFAEVDDAMQISSSAILPVDQLGEDFDEAIEQLGKRLYVANGPIAPAAVFVVGHGPNGDMLADRVMDGVRPGLPPESPIIGLHNDGEIVQVRSGDRPWVPVGPPADVSAEMIGMGLPIPSASREMSDRRWQPDPVPGYPSLPATERAGLDAAPPSKRAQVAVELLTDLSNGAVDDVPTTQSRLAALISSDPQNWIQDHVMMTAVSASTPALADELRRLYVQAPPEDRQSIAGPAALAAFAQHETSQPLRAIRPQIEETGPSRNLLPIMDRLANGATPPTEFKGMMQDVHQRLHDNGIPAKRDNAWQQHQSAAPKSEGPSSSAPPQPPASPGPEDLPPSAGPSGPSMT